MFEIIFGVILLFIVAGGIWAFIFSQKIKREGIETEAVVSRIKKNVWTEETGPDTVTLEYYVSYTNQEGQTVEAVLSHVPKKRYLEEGSRVKIKYLPSRQDYVVLEKEA